MNMISPESFYDWAMIRLSLPSRGYGVETNRATIDEIQPGTVFRHVILKFDSGHPFYMSEYANGYILAGQSEYFKRILTANPGDAHEIALSYPDLDNFAVQDLIKCMVSGKFVIEKDKEHILRVLVAAHKFELREMMELCLRAYTIVRNTEISAFGAPYDDFLPFDVQRVLDLESFRLE